MRLPTWAWACTVSGLLGVAMADEPAKAPASVPASPPAASPTETTPPASPAATSSTGTTPPTSTPAAASTSAAKPAMTEDQRDKLARAEGYSVQVRNGEKYYCKRADVLGSRLPGDVQCTPAQILMLRQRQAQEDLERMQRGIGTPTNK